MVANQTYAVNANAPTQVYPYGVQRALTLINTGLVSVFVAPDPVMTGGYEIVAGNQVRWEADSPLYAYALVDGGLLQVIEALVSGQESVVAAVSGTVSIGTPVTVQGGGVNLVNTDVIFNEGGSYEIDIPLPADGQTYSGLTINIADFPDFTDAFVQWTITDPTGNIVVGDGLIVTTLAADMFGPNGAGVLGLFQERVTFPTNYPLPLKLTLQSLGGSTASQHHVYVQVFGVANTAPAPFTDLTNYFNRSRMMFAAGAGRVAMMPPSHSPYDVLVYSTGALTATLVQVYDVATATWVHRNSAQLTVPTYAGSNTYKIRYPGGGASLLVGFTCAASTSIWME